MKQSHGDMEVVHEDTRAKFEALRGGALRIRIRRGEHYGSDLRLYLRQFGPEPEEVYFRYYLRFANDWDPRESGGKLPGIAGTYGKAGWGERRPTPEADGWSLRGLFLRAFPNGHPFKGQTALGTYGEDLYQRESWIWPGATLDRNRWYCIEQYVRLNRVGDTDGIHRVWIDGRLSQEKQGLELRKNTNTKIETIWVNVYHGGTVPSPTDMSMFIDGVVVARSYIGPMTRGN